MATIFALNGSVREKLLSTQYGVRRIDYGDQQPRTAWAKETLKTAVALSIAGGRELLKSEITSAPPPEKPQRINGRPVLKIVR